MAGRSISTAILVIAAALLTAGLSSCGSSESTPVSGTTHDLLQSTLAELHELTVPAGTDPDIFERLKTELAAQLQSGPSERLASAPPGLNSDRVTTLMADDNGDGSFTLTWRYANTGDYDLNGEVNVADITPIAQYFGATPDSANWTDAQAADGDANGEVNTADITPIAVNFASACSGYIVESAITQDGSFSAIGSADWNDATADMPVKFTTAVTLGYGEWVRVTPVDSTGTPGIAGEAVEAVEWFDDFTFDVTAWQPDAVYLNEGDAAALISYDTDTGDFVFDSQTLNDAQIAIGPGNVVLVHGAGIGRVDSVTTEGSQTTAHTSYAALTDAILDGNIAWDYGVDFRPERITAIAADCGRQVSDPVDPIQEFEFELDGYKYKLILLLDNQFCWVSLQVSKGLGATFTGKFSADGFFERFRTTDSITIAGGQLQNFDHSYDGMRGDLFLELTATAGTSSTDEFVNLKLPWTILQYTFLAGPVPVTLKLKLQCVMGLSVPVAGSAWVDVDFSYDSALGLTYNGTDVGVSGGAGQYSFGEGTHQTGAPNPIVANFGIGFPRVELSVLNDTLVPWGQTAFLIEGNFTPVFPALQQAKVAYIGAIGYKLDILGLFGIEGSHTIWNEEEVIWEAGETEE